MLSIAATKAASSIYGAAVAIAIAAAYSTTTAPPTPYPQSIAVVAQRRAPTTGDVCARPIFGIDWHWCINQKPIAT